MILILCLFSKIHNEQAYYMSGPKVNTHNEEMIELIRRAPKTTVDPFDSIDCLFLNTVV